MARDDRFYAFIIAHTSRSKARVQRIRVEKKVVTLFFGVAAVVTVCLCYGLYGLTQQAKHLRTEYENQRLRVENERQRQELEKLNNRVEKVEDTSRKLAEKSGVVENKPMSGSGGPALPLDEMGLATVIAKMGRLEEDMRGYEAVLRERGYTPTLWPVQGTLEGGFGGRRNPFGGPGYEFHSGQDIEAPWGAPVISGASG
jgi:murein DD-endopeptidase MepM/ murein hydrolase activator NlpD